METHGAAAAREPAHQAGKGGARAANGEAWAANGEAATISREHAQNDIARSVLGAFGLRPFHVFDGERYHVCFAAAKELVDELDYDAEVLEDFFSNCRRSPTVSKAQEDAFPKCRTPTAAVPALDAKEEGPSAQDREIDYISARSPSPREIYYIMEEHYLSTSPTPREIDHDLENDPVVENQLMVENLLAANNQPAAVEENHHGYFINPRTMKEIHFVMEDNYLSPEELRLSICFPLLLSPPARPDDALPSAPNDVPMDEPLPCEAGPSIDRATGGNVVPSNDGADGGNVLEASIRSNVGKVKDRKGSRPKKKKAKVVEEFDASQSVRPDKPWTGKPSPRKRKPPQKKATKEYSEEWAEPPWNGLNVGDLEEQTGDSWVVEDEKRRGFMEENPGDVVNPGQPKKSFWPTPLYGSPGCQVKAPPPPIEKGFHLPAFAGSEEDSSEVEVFEESVEQSRKREEVALAKYALLFKGDQSWRKKFLDGFKLTCDICFSKRLVLGFYSYPVSVPTARFSTIRDLPSPLCLIKNNGSDFFIHSPLSLSAL